MVIKFETELHWVWQWLGLLCVQHELTFSELIFQKGVWYLLCQHSILGNMIWGLQQPTVMSKSVIMATRIWEVVDWGYHYICFRKAVYYKAVFMLVRDMLSKNVSVMMWPNYCSPWTLYLHHPLAQRGGFWFPAVLLSWPQLLSHLHEWLCLKQHTFPHLTILDLLH